jgi:pimeloyl-ACP methyl ester carboxylesterase
MIAVQTHGSGQDVVFIHGTASSSRDIPTVLLRHQLRVTTYDRRGSTGWALAGGAEPPSVEEHAHDAAGIIDRMAVGPVCVCGLSFGAIVALEVARRRPDLVRSLALYEPPLHPTDDERSPALASMLDEFRDLIGRRQPEDAAEFFLRRALTDAMWDRLPPLAKGRLRGMWPQIYGDVVATERYRINPRELGSIDTSVWLLRGERLRSTVEGSMAALGRALPRTRIRTIRAAGHVLDQRGWRELTTILCELTGPDGGG